MKTKLTSSLLALAVALAIEPSARAQTPLPVTDAALLQMLATGQMPAPGALPGSGQQIPGVAAGDLNNDGIIDPAPTNGSPAMSANSATTGYGGGLYVTGGQLALTNDNFTLVSNGAAPASASYGGAFYLQNNPATNNYGGAIYNYGGAIYQASAPTSAQQLSMWYNDVFNNAAPPQSGSVAGVCDGVDQDCDGSSRSTTSSLWGEELPGEALTDQQLDLLILDALTAR